MGHENFSIVGKGSNEEEKNTYNAHSKTFKKKTLKIARVRN